MTNFVVISQQTNTQDSMVLHHYTGKNHDGTLKFQLDEIDSANDISHLAEEYRQLGNKIYNEDVVPLPEIDPDFEPPVAAQGDNKIILTDFSQIALAAIHVDSSAQDIAKNPSDENKGFIKHFMLNSIRSNFVLHKKKYGQMVIATDSNKGYWRREYFDNYKCQRRAAKKLDQSGIDWPWVMGIVDETINDLEKYFPFPVIRVNGAEGDDIFGTLVELFSTDEKYFEEDILGDSTPLPVLGLTSDKDSFQCYRFKNYKQYSPREKKIITPENGWRKSLIEKIIKGESGASSDSIPNIRSQDNIFLLEGVRQKPISQARLDAFYAATNLEDACLDDEEKKNLIRNQTLVDFKYIPETLKSDIITVYNQQAQKKASKMALMNYLTQNKMSNLLGNITDFYL